MSRFDGITAVSDETEVFENLEHLKAQVCKLLVINHDYMFEVAAETVETSSKSDDNSHLWDGNANPEDLANYLANEGDDD